MRDLMLQDPTRRKALFTGGGLAALAAVPEVALADGVGNDPPAKMTSSGKALPEYAGWKNADAMIVHSANTIELKRSHFGHGLLTPTDCLFVRNNLNPPSADIVKDREAWAVEVTGVAKPARLTLADLKRMGLTSVTMVLQCSGNGRGYFPHKPSGTQWKEGAAGCVVFTGVAVKDVVKALGGLADGAQYMTGTGGETIPDGVDPKTVMVERSVPLSDIEDALLAWELNGEPLPLAHGGPVRMIVPGYTGVNNVKYVRQLAFTAQQSPAKIQQSSYRFTPVGVKGSPDAPSLWKVPVNSWITTPADQSVKAGRVQLAGVAFGGFYPIKGIEVSVDGGQTWTAAKWFGPDLGRYAWRNFVLEVDLKPGTYRVASRAVNDQGEAQPKERQENERGYNNNSWLDRSIELVVA
ncbi:MAG TPA: sulfite oxidase [Ottowia sp.]|uniref:SorT family sulfite dehydrogenase catalytic subunit n=1 Tax=Ottowia sp. TaxID=1898956 RepID=UPI002C371E9C|nr:sulfite oxidase [Ottowia sp.]HMN21596.1 sulfite oxidase [Ottowia sp.]